MTRNDTITDIRSIGKNGSMLYLPKAIMEKWGRENGDHVRLEVENGVLVARPVVLKVIPQGADS